MKISVTVVATGTREFTIDTETLPISSVEYLLANGLKQSLGDAGAGKKGDEAVKAIDARWDKIVAGTMGLRDSSARLTPIEHEVRRIVTDMLTTMVKRDEADKMAKRPLDALVWLITKKNPQADAAKISAKADEKLTEIAKKAQGVVRARETATAGLDLDV